MSKTILRSEMDKLTIYPKIDLTVQDTSIHIDTMVECKANNLVTVIQLIFTNNL